MEKTLPYNVEKKSLKNREIESYKKQNKNNYLKNQRNMWGKIFPIKIKIGYKRVQKINIMKKKLSEDNSFKASFI